MAEKKKKLQTPPETEEEARERRQREFGTPTPGLSRTNVQEISQLGQVEGLEDIEGPRGRKRRQRGGTDDETAMRTGILAGLLRRLLGR